MACRQIIFLPCKYTINDKIMFSGLWFLSIVSISNSVIIHTAIMKYDITKKFESMSCSNGLLTTDLVTLDIKVTDLKQAPTDDTSLVLEVEDLVDNFTITMCKLPFRLGCSLRVVQGCFCVRATEKEYHFRYRSVANKVFRNGQLKVNGEVVQDIVFPEIYSANPPVKMIIDGRKSVSMGSDCLAKAPANKNVSFMFCVPDLSKPTLRVEYGSNLWDDYLQKETTKKCYTSYFKVKTETVIFIYRDCSREVRHSCSIQAVDEKDLNNETDLATTTSLTTSTSDEEASESELILKYLLVSIAAVTLISIIAITCKIRMKKRDTLHDLTDRRLSSITHINSSPVDPEPARMRSSSPRLTLKSISPSMMSRRTTVKVSRHRSSTEV